VQVSIRRLLPLLLVAMVMSSSIFVTTVQAAAVTIAGTTAVNIRSCPKLDCKVLAVAPLGSPIETTGEPVDGFTPVTYGNVDGFAFSLYLAAPGQDLWFREGEAGCKRVALIFDIGIGFQPSQTVIDTLVETKTPATMFPMGEFANNQPDFVRNLDRLGFPIGTHGQESIKLTELGPDQIKWDLNTSMDVIAGVIGRTPEPLFTPYAATTNAYIRSIAAQLGLLPVGWKVAAVDYTWTATGDSVYNDVMTEVYDGAIVELHLDGPATEQSTALALPRIIHDLTAQGYTFVTVPDMLLPCANLALSQ
jgi:peptidoglycan-N-acetylglucosamine deacetylase